MHPGYRGPRGWLRGRPFAGDLLLAGVLAAASIPTVLFAEQPPPQYHDTDAVSLAGGAATCLLLVARRRAPVLVAVGCALLTSVMTTAQYYPGPLGWVAVLVGCYTVGAYRGLAVSIATTTLTVVLDLPSALLGRPFSFADFAIGVGITFAVWWLGRSIRLRRAYLAELENRTYRLERQRDSDARAARAEERSRIARELHDVVAHYLSVMTVQASAAGRIIDRDRDGARDALEAIETMGRSTLGEMRRIVGVLRTDGDPEPAVPARSPQPGIHDVPRLVDQMRETGLRVQLWIEGQSRPLSMGVDLAAYRLVQEALTNTLKHAGPQARSWVRVHYGDRELSLRIEDDGRGAVADLGRNDHASAHGLVGMRERVALYGGELRVGPRGGGGFEVRARFPMGA